LSIGLLLARSLLTAESETSRVGGRTCRDRRHLSGDNNRHVHLGSLTRPTDDPSYTRLLNDVTWYSTQHNLLAYAFLRLLGNELTADGDRSSANSYYTAANQVSSGIESQLLVPNASNLYFIEGLNDNVQALDADALGIMYLQDHGETNNAQKVLAYTQSAFALTGQSIVKSSDPATYNETYSAPGPFTGFAPYIGPNAPNV
jgi:hypothetical protein